MFYIFAVQDKWTQTMALTSITEPPDLSVGVKQYFENLGTCKSTYNIKHENKEIQNSFGLNYEDLPLLYLFMCDKNTLLTVRREL